MNTNSIWAQQTYYIDSQNGNDNNDGLCKNTAWKSHTMVSTVTFQPGDTIAFKKGSQFIGPIQFTESGTEQNPITITSYGEGERPRFTNPDDMDMNGNCIRISGSWIIIEGLYFHDTPPTENWRRLTSIFMMGAVLNMEVANHNIIRNNMFVECTKAIQSTGEYTLITNNYMDGPNHALWNDESSGGGWGPMGIQLGIGNQEVCYNTIKNYLTTDSDYGSDGGAIELDDGRFHKDNFYIHHNYSEGNPLPDNETWDIGAFQFQGSVIITSPEVGELFCVPAEITINADVTDINISISKVEFYINSNKLGEDHSFPYSYPWNVDRVGKYSYL